MTPEALNTYWWIPLAAYAIGSIPFGYLIMRQAGQGDIRSVGSGNVGATNVARAAGIGAGALTFFLDAGKRRARSLVGRANYRRLRYLDDCGGARRDARSHFSSVAWPGAADAAFPPASARFF